MNFDRLSNAPCIIQPTPAPDPRCDDAEFALANPGVCPAQSSLIIRPSVSLFCVNDSIQFRVFLYQNNVETELTTGVTFESSNSDTFVVGVNSGYGTAIAAGIANVKATYGARFVTSKITVGTGTGDACCDELTLASAIVIDNSRSMTLAFGGQYASRLSFARAAALTFASDLIYVDNTPKDTLKVWSFNEDATEETDDFTNDVTELAAAVAGIVQAQDKTDLLEAFTTITDDLLLQEVNRRVVVLITDGEHTSDTNTQQIIDAATLFKDGGGIVIVVGVRASGVGFDLLQRLATPGYFVNATEDSPDTTLGDLNFIKGTICAGKCIPAGDEFTNLPQLDYSDFLNWQVIQGQVNLVGPGLLDLQPGNGLYVDMASGSKAILRSTDSFALISGRNYRISFNLAGNQRELIAGQGVKVYVREVGINDSDPNIFEQTIFPTYSDQFHGYGFVFPAVYDATVRLYFEQIGTASNPVCGNLLDVVLFQDFTTLETLLNDNFDSENLTFVDPVCGPSSAIDPINDPEVPGIEEFILPGSDVWNGNTYIYAVSYLTPEGETDISDTVSVGTSVTADQATRVTFGTPPANVIAVRIWRNKEEGNTDLWLLANLNPAEHTSFDDTETHTQFTDRFDVSVVPPTANTTGKTAGELGIGYAYCCYYFTEIVGVDQLVSSVPEMTSLTEPSGSVTSNTIQSPGHEWWGFDGDLDTLFAAVGETTGSTNEFATPVYLAYEFSFAKIIRRYAIVSGEIVGGVLGEDGTIEWPKTWQFQGSNDGSSWTTLDTQTDIEWFQNQTKSYDIGSPQSFLHYRLLITHTHLSGEIYGYAYVAELRMYENTTDEITTFINNCPECASDTPGAQLQDGSPLPDIESGFTPPTVYTSTKSRCVSCDTGLLNLPPEPLAFTSLTHSAIGGAVTDIVQMTDGPVKLKVFRLNLAGKVFNTPVTFNLSGGDAAGGPFTLIVGYIQEYLPASVIQFIIPDDTPEYEFYTVGFNLITTGSTVITNEDSFYGVPTTNSVCGTATETSTTSQADADAQASASALVLAQAQLNCVAVYTATESFTAKCDLGEFGNSVTKSATRQSAISQQDAERLASEAAQEAAEAELDCTLSNNTQNITINDATSTASKANPYPSVKRVTGLTGVITNVRVTLTGITHNSPDDIGIVLRSPEGTIVWLMRNVGGVPPGSTGTANVDLVLDDSFGSFLPDADPLVSGNFKPKGYSGEYNIPELPVAPYGTLLSDFDGEDPNGSWSLWVVDDLTTFSGVISGGWELTLTTA